MSNRSAGLGEPEAPERGLWDARGGAREPIPARGPLTSNLHVCSAACVNYVHPIQWMDECVDVLKKQN